MKTLPISDCRLAIELFALLVMNLKIQIRVSSCDLVDRLFALVK
jgi:hypothetical protein